VGSALRNGYGDEHGSALTPEFRDFRKCAQQSHQSRFPAGARMRANQSSQPFAFRLFSLRIVISFGFIFAQAYTSSEHRCEDTRKYLVYYSFCLFSPFYIFSTFFTSSYMYFTFLLCFFLLFFFSPFVLFGFYTVYYIYACTLDYSTEDYTERFRSPSFSHLARTRRTRISLPFTLRTSAQPSQPSPITSLLLRTCLTTFAHPYTCDRPRLFCFGHGQRCASASTGS
jgi:hypothetical protein